MNGCVNPFKAGCFFLEHKHGDTGAILRAALAEDGIDLSADEACDLTRALLRLAELGALTLVAEPKALSACSNTRRITPKTGESGTRDSLETTSTRRSPGRGGGVTQPLRIVPDGDCDPAADSASMRKQGPTGGGAA